MATSQLVDTDTLDFTEFQPEKLRVRGNPWKGIISVRTGFYASRDAGFCVPEITDVISILYHPCQCHPCTLCVQVCILLHGKGVLSNDNLIKILSVVMHHL